MTKYGGLMYVGTSMLVFFIIMVSLFKVPSIMGTVLTCILICLLSIWVVYDTQLIVGGGKYEELSMDDYCLGALIIYSDIVTIFMYIL
jgi:FtsH-binding integral membrane protein